jgi:carbon monoxide dehydrogenase subunit G
MTQVSRSTRIDADPRAVIDYIADVTNHPAFIGPLKTVTNVRGDAKRPGSTWDWTYVLAGVEISGRGTTSEYAEGKRFAFKTSGIESTFSYAVEPEGKGSKLTAIVSYEIPQNVLAKVADRTAVERLNEIEADRAVENLKVILKR